MNNFRRTRAASAYVQWHARLEAFVRIGADPSVWTSPEQFDHWLAMTNEAIRKMTMEATKVQCLGEAIEPAEPSSSQPS